MPTPPMRALDIRASDEEIRSRWAGARPPPVVFVMGLHRSGTTILYEYLSRILPVAPLTLQDVVFYRGLVQSWLEDGGRSDRERLVAHLEASRISRRWLDDIALSPDTVEEYGWILKREAGSFGLVDATAATFDDLTRKLAVTRPEARALLLKNPWDAPRSAEIAGRFPGARFVFLRRDPVEILNSEVRNGLALYGRGSPLVRLLTRGMPGVRALLAGARGLRRLVGERRFERLLLAWLFTDIEKNLEGFRAAMDAVPGERAAHVGYGELVDRPEETLLRLARFLGLPASDAVHELAPRRRPGGLTPAVARREDELRERFRRGGFDWALGA